MTGRRTIMYNLYEKTRHSDNFNYCEVCNKLILTYGETLKSHYHSFSRPNVCLAWLQMELCRAANIFAAR